MAFFKSIDKIYLHFFILIMSQRRKEIKVLSHLIHAQNIKCLGNNITEEVRYLYKGNFKNLQRKMEEVLKNEKKTFDA